MSGHVLKGVKGFEKRTDMFYVDPGEILVVNGWNDRTDFSGEDELVASIKEVGVLQPLKVKKNQDKRLELVDGERRLRATLRARKEGAEIKTVPAIVIRSNVSEIDMYLESIIANTGKPLNPVEEANSFKRLISWGLSIKEIANKSGRSEVHVRNRLELADAIPAVKEAVAKEEITVKDARQMVKESGGKVEPQQKALEEKKSAPKSVRLQAVHHFVKGGKAETKSKKGDKCDPVLQLLEDAEFRNKIIESGYDPETLKISVSKLK